MELFTEAWAQAYCRKLNESKGTIAALAPYAQAAQELVKATREVL